MTNSLEKVTSALRSLYESWGYRRFRMSRFEEYDLYVTNKDFLVSDSIITFNDTDGKLMALKPDVTLSIIKNSADDGSIKKMFYNENVYRVTKEALGSREIRQIGLECVGKVDLYCLFEVVTLACLTMKEICEDWVVDISHLGIVSDLLGGASLNEKAKKSIIKRLGEKNAHEIREICAKEGADEDKTELLCRLSGFADRADKVIEQLEAFPENSFDPEYLTTLKKLCAMLEKAGVIDRVRLDFSVINDMNYYNGVVFKGFAEGLASGILSGGQYDRLMERMGKTSKAVGFAVYADMLDSRNSAAPVADEVIEYGADCDPISVFEKANKLRETGKRVLVIPEKDDKECAK